ncbi:uncharacterized protein LOC120281134 [Dioscorea cayenensis subsp. rotundata]|uniref:Uncharacterized protein LOC120281134 n=1 Tax=Dioscorea cayennensis subsp. rotundata TaxID=55577 RepID=A0AB40CZV4_DIOCR|nr:uncharacterized protein LOC120281134 [Dioscorea cayenensis subsp. rotundata]
MASKLVQVGEFSLSVEFVMKKDNFIWRCTSVYGPTERNHKVSFWEELMGTRGDAGIPWVICGDFNEPPSVGRRFTWTNGQADPIWVKLDRFLINAEWANCFPRVMQVMLPRLGSDHVPIRLEVGYHSSKPRPFRFEKVWITVEGFQELVQQWWAETTPRGYGAFIVSKKLAGVRTHLRQWSKFSFGSIKLKKLALMQEMEVLDIAKESRSLTLGEIQRELDLSFNLEEIRRQEEIYWRQRSRTHGLKRVTKTQSSSMRWQMAGRIFWDTVSADVVLLCEDFYWHHANLDRINWASITLIPKVDAPESPGDFGPISLINSSLKIISKVLANRLSKVMNLLVDKEQSAFLKGRCILDNIATAEELIFSIHKRRLSGHILKVDYNKAFDRVDWDFLLDLLKVRGFGDRWIGWINCILLSSKAIILVNGSRMGMCVTKVDYDKVLVGVPLGDFGNRCDLHYADDLLVLTTGGLEDLQIVKIILLMFEGLTGLATNFLKTCLYTSDLGKLPEREAAGTLSCERGMLPVTYLGIPISGRRPRKQDWEGLIAKIRKRLSSWKMKHLSIGGRLTLINSVHMAVPTY